MNDDPEDGPPDPQLDPTKSPGMGVDVDGLADIEVSRDDITIGDADPYDLTAGDTAPVEDSDLAELLADLTDGSAVERKRAAIELGQREPERAVIERLRLAARADPDADVRQFAVEALGELGGSAAESVALDRLADDDPWVRAEAVVALDNLDRAGHADRFEAALADDHHAVRRNALIALWKLRGADVFETAVRFVDDENDRVREWAATILADIDDERATEYLEELAQDDSDIVAKSASQGLDGVEARPEDSAPAPEQSRFDTPPEL